MTLFAFIAPATARNVLLILVGGCYLGYHLYHLWRRWRGKAREEVRSKSEEVRSKDSNSFVHLSATPTPSSQTSSEGTVGASVPLARNQAAADSAPVDDCGHVGRVTLPTVQHKEEEAIHCSPSTSTSTALSGEELYAQARAMPHQPIPDCEMDGEYLKLLAQSAAKDYPRALAKLGDYALRRGWNVEAYYWLWRAKKAGMGNLERTLLQVRSEWANGGFRRESANEYEHFSCEQGNIGYALLCIDTRHDAADAKAFLSERAPDFLR